MTKSLFVSALVAVLALASGPASVDAHGYLMVPAAKLASSGDPTKYAATIYGPSALTAPAGMKFSDTIQNNLKAFTTAFKSAGWSSLASFIKKKAPSAGACGTTSLTPSSPKTVGDYVQWSSFAESHVGPCEVWCDGSRVFQNDNCAGAYKSTPAKLAINKSKCAKAKQLVFYWLALHEINWQVYINCVSLKGESRSYEDDSEDVVEAVEEQSVANMDERANDEDCDEDLPEPAGSDDEDCNDDLPEPDCDEEYPEPGDDEYASSTAPPKSSTNAPSPTVKPTTTAPSSGSKPSTGDDVAGDADCDEDLPEPDCDDEYPEPSDDEDCDEDLPEPAETSTDGEVGGESDSYNFDALQRGGKYTPGKAETDDY